MFDSEELCPDGLSFKFDVLVGLVLLLLAYWISRSRKAQPSLLASNENLQQRSERILRQMAQKAYEKPLYSCRYFRGKSKVKSNIKESILPLLLTKCLYLPYDYL